MVLLRQIIETSDCSTESKNYLSLSDCGRVYFKSLILFCPFEKVEMDLTHLSPRNKTAYCLLLQIIINIEVVEDM